MLTLEFSKGNEGASKELTADLDPCERSCEWRLLKALWPGKERTVTNSNTIPAPGSFPFRVADHEFR